MTNKRFLINVTNYEINRCDPEDNEKCAIAMSLRYKGYIRLQVEFKFIRLGNTPYNCSWYVRHWQKRIIAGKKASPITLVFNDNKSKVGRKILWFTI